MGKIADISKYQGAIDWRAAAGELDFCILRASCGDQPDQRFDDNVAGCKRYGVPFGVYHYFKATTDEAAHREAALFCTQGLPAEPRFWVIDCESDRITQAERKVPGTARKLVTAFVDGVKKIAGRNVRMGVYIGHHLYKAWALHYESFDFVWIPRYGENSGQPETRPAFPCDLWQYTSAGQLAGVKGRVDLNMLNGSKPLGFFIDQKEVSNMITGKELARFAVDCCERGVRYWYGTCYYKCTESLYNSKRRQYPSHYGPSRKSGYMADVAAGAMCADCVGLIKGAVWSNLGVHAAKYGTGGCPDRSANGMLSYCKSKGMPNGSMDTFPDEPGLLVHKQGHVGIAIGGGLAVEAKGFSSDVVTSKVAGRGWTSWARLPFISYDGRIEAIQPPMRTLGSRTLRRGSKGSDVVQLQEALVALGFSCGTYGDNGKGVDGKYGYATEGAVKGMQHAADIAVDGIFGPASLAALRKMEAAGSAPDDPEDGSASDGGSDDDTVFTVTIPGVDAATATYLLETYAGASAKEESGVWT